MPSLAILWHLHQPDYRDPRTGRPTMPWVRLHAVRGYRDLLVESVEEGVAVTVNVVPSLLDQLLHYADGGDDPHLALTRREADALAPDEVEAICRTFPAGHHAMSDAHPAYRRLRARVEGGHRPSVDSLRDLQVWSTLAWFGATAARDFPEIGELWAKGSGFDEGDKAAMLAVQDRILKDIPRQLAAVVEAEGPSLSTTPYYHPILPLVIDARHARRCMPHVPELDFAWPEDALRQLTDARARLQQLVGIAPMGLWPSEGSVSPEVVELAGQAGFSWLATDEGILARSEVSRHRRGPGGWDLGHGITGFFRDRDLSDRVGFHYAKADPEHAAAELLGLAAERAGDGVLLVALDGENPWEAFPDAGAAFRSAVYRGLRRGPMGAITLDAASERAVVGRVHRLHTGSWIHADFGIWFGHEDDRRAWRAVAEARRAVEEAEDRASREAAMPHILAAEGSDWTWWYGTEFSTPFADHFDALFRAHLQAAWRAVGRRPPRSLDVPIASTRALDRREPLRLLAPSLELPPTWAQWTGAGEVRLAGGAMALGQRHVDVIRYGWSADGALWLRVDLPRPLPGEGASTRWRLEVDGEQLILAYGSEDRGESGGLSAVGDRRTLLLRAAAPATGDGSHHRVRVRVVRADHEVAYPAHGDLTLTRPRRPNVSWWAV